MMRSLPFRVNNRSFAGLYYAITRGKANFLASMNQINMSPLIPVVMDIIYDLAEK